jgi:signal transduction histidine kinase
MMRKWSSQPSEHARQERARALRVLIVEDNPGDARLVMRMLRDADDPPLDVAIATDLAEAIVRLAPGDVDAALVDLYLPDSQGLETFRSLHRRFPALPIVVFTGMDDENVALAAVHEGAQDYLSKGRITAATLLRALRYAIERRAAVERFGARALRELPGNLLRARDEERRRIARDLHDGIAPYLVALSIDLKEIAAAIPPRCRKARKTLAADAALIKRCLDDVRALSRLLHPPLLDEAGLVTAIRGFADGFARRTRVRVALDLTEMPRRLPPEVELAFFRIVQEALTNVHRHSGSNTAAIRLAAEGGELVLEVSDRGHGLAVGPDGLRVGVGLAGMRERMRLVGGTFDVIAGRPGTTVRAVMPLPLERA